MIQLIFPNTREDSTESMQSSPLYVRVHRELFELMSDATIRAHVLIGPVTHGQEEVRVDLRIRHGPGPNGSALDQNIALLFGCEYPAKPPIFSFLPDVGDKGTVQIPQIISKCTLVQQKNWNPQIKIRDILMELINSLGIFWASQSSFRKNLQNKIQEWSDKSRAHLNGHSKIQRNGIIYGSYEASLLCRLEEVSNQVTYGCAQAQKACKILISACRHHQITVHSTLERLLLCQQFRRELRKQLENGLWINKILKSQAGMLCKKELIKNSTELLNKIRLSSVREKPQEDAEENQENTIK